MQKSIAFFFQNENPKYRFIPYFIFGVLGILIYFQCFQYGYALDDIIVASENKFVKKGFDGITEIFCKESFTGYFGEQKNLVAGSRYRRSDKFTCTIPKKILANTIIIQLHFKY